MIIPTYKNRGGLEKSIRSVIEQTFTDIEIIVVDDNGAGTPEQLETAKIMDVFSKNDNVRYIVHKENRNGAAARNTGIYASTAPLIAFLDDDDCFFPEKCDRQRRFLLEHAEFDAVYCQGMRGGKIMSSDLPTGSLSKDILLGLSNMPTSSLMFKREALLAIGGFDESFRRHQDFELLLRYFANGGIIAPIQMPLYEMGINNGENIMNGERFEQLKDKFLNKFEDAIQSIDSIEPGFTKRCYAYNYGNVFISYIKTGNIRGAWRVSRRYFLYSPKLFLAPFWQSLKLHLC